MKEVERRASGGKSFRKLVLLDQSEYASLKAISDKCKNGSEPASKEDVDVESERKLLLMKQYLDKPGTTVEDRMALYNMAIARQQQRKLTTMDDEPVATSQPATGPQPHISQLEWNTDEFDGPKAATQPPAPDPPELPASTSVISTVPAPYAKKAKKLLESILASTSGIKVDPDTGRVAVSGYGELVDSYFPQLFRSLFVTKRGSDTLPGRDVLIQHLAKLGITANDVSAPSAKRALTADKHPGPAQDGTGGGRVATPPRPVLLPPPPGKRPKVLFMYRL